MILRSPLYGIMSKNTMLITYAGRKSGRPYTIPVNYVHIDDRLLTSSFTDRTWRRNFRAENSTWLLVQDTQIKAVTKLMDDQQATASDLAKIAKTASQYAGFLNIEIDCSGNPEPDAVAKAARDRVIIEHII